MRFPRIFVYGRLRRSPLHLIPSLHAVDLAWGDPLMTRSRWYQFCWRGWTLNVDMPVRPRREMKPAWQIPSIETMDRIADVGGRVVEGACVGAAVAVVTLGAFVSAGVDGAEMAQSWWRESP